MNNYNTVLSEIINSSIYKDFQLSRVEKQLPLPFKYSDSYFYDKKEQLNHILRTMSNMKIGYEFEIYLPKLNSYIDNIDYDSETYEVNTLNHINSNFLEELEEVIPRQYNRTEYNNLTRVFNAWVEEFIKRIVINNLANKGLFPSKYGDDHNTYKKEYDEGFNKLNKPEHFFELYFDDYVNDSYGGNLIDLIRDFQFDNTCYGLGFDEDGYIITDIIHQHDDNDDDDDEEEYEELKSYLDEHIDDASIEIFNRYHKEDKECDTTWYIEPDSSLTERPDSSYFPVEVSTKTYPAHEFKNLFNSTLTHFKNYAEQFSSTPKTNSSTGLHFGVSFKSISKINFLKLVVLGQDAFWLKKMDRYLDNHYCQSQIDSVLANLQTNTYLTVDDMLEGAKRAIHTTKMYAINFFHTAEVDPDRTFGNDYIEFRLTGNDYYGKYRKENLETIEWFLFIIVATISDKLWENEYISWLINEYNETHVNVPLTDFRKSHPNQLSFDFDNKSDELDDKSSSNSKDQLRLNI